MFAARSGRGSFGGKPSGWEGRALTAVERQIGIDAEGNPVKVPKLIGLRDRAIIAAMVFTFARVGAMLAKTVEDYHARGKRSRLRLQEKGGKQHEMPAHHTLEEYLDAYIDAAGIRDDGEGPLFRTAPGSWNTLTRNHMRTADVRRMIPRRLKATDIRTKAGCHSFRATGITCYREGKGTLENAQQMASHASPRTTQLYDRTSDQVTLDEVERIVIRCLRCERLRRADSCVVVALVEQSHARVDCLRQLSGTAHRAGEHPRATTPTLPKVRIH